MSSKILATDQVFSFFFEDFFSCLDVHRPETRFLFARTVILNLLLCSFRDETFKRSLAKLREDILRANGLVREANNFAEELGQQTRFSVTLQIPPQNLSPNRKVSLLLFNIFIS